MDPIELRGMEPFERAEPTERAFREIAEKAGLPEPDEVEYRETSLVFWWHEQKLVVEIDLTDDPAEDVLGSS